MLQGRSKPFWVLMVSDSLINGLTKRETKGLGVASQETSVKLGEIIRAQKTDVKVTEWDKGKIPKRLFPLSRARNGIQMGPDWSWRVVTFTALNQNFRILMRLNESTEYFASILALDVNGDSAVLCHHELHTSHRNWHCHYVPGDTRQTFPGVWRDTERMVSWPTFSDDECRTEFTVTKANALSVSADRFRFSAQGALL